MGGGDKDEDDELDRTLVLNDPPDQEEPDDEEADEIDLDA